MLPVAVPLRYCPRVRCHGPVTKGLALRQGRTNREPPPGARTDARSPASRCSWSDLPENGTEGLELSSRHRSEGGDWHYPELARAAEAAPRRRAAPPHRIPPPSSAARGRVM